MKNSIQSESKMKIEDRRSRCVWKTAWPYSQLGRILRQIGIWQMSQSVSATKWRINLENEDKNDRGTRYITGHLRVGGCTIYALSTCSLAKRGSGDSCGPKGTMSLSQMLSRSANKRTTRVKWTSRGARVFAYKYPFHWSIESGTPKTKSSH